MLVQNSFNPQTRKALKGLNSPAQGNALGFYCKYNLNPEGVAQYEHADLMEREFNPYRVVNDKIETQGVALGLRMQTPWGCFN